MKIVCDNCATKYQIADEKVSGKAFKIRCKKCSHVIVVNKGPADGAAAAEPAPGTEAAPPAEAAPPGDAIWHLVINQEQVGPMTADEVRAKIKAKQVEADTFSWREGLEDWQKLSAIDDFKGSFADEPAAKKPEMAAAPPDAQTMAATAAPAVAPGRDEPVRSANPGAATIVADSPVAMAAPVASRRAPEPESEPESDAGGGNVDAPVKSMMGARSENSVLFSLNNLSALAGGGGGGGGGGKAAEKPVMGHAQSEASGLIDIRAMAAATLGMGGGGFGGPSPGANRAPDPFGGGDVAPVFTPLAPAILMPSNEPAGTPKWVFALIGVGGVVMLGLIGVVVWALQSQPVATNNVPVGKSPDTTIPESGKPAGTGTESAGTPNIKPATPETKPEIKPETKPDTKGSTPDKKASSKDSGSKSDGDKKSKGTKDKETKSEPGKAPEPVAAPKAPEAPKPVAKPKAKDDLDALLDGAAGNTASVKSSKSEKKDLPETLSQSVIQSTLKGVSLGSCKAEGATGIVNVRLTIAGSGKVTSSAPQGGAAGGECVAKAVKGARFPEFSGDPISLTFPFFVR